VTDAPPVTGVSPVTEASPAAGTRSASRRQGGATGRMAGRFGWGLGDQAMSSLSNAAMSFYVARTLSPAEFGAFSIAYVTYSFALNASRGLATEPLLVRFSHTNAPAWRGSRWALPR
jgi:hypothetical protein